MKPTPQRLIVFDEGLQYTLSDFIRKLIESQV
jgi:hypothetical protein